MSAAFKSVFSSGELLSKGFTPVLEDGEFYYWIAKQGARRGEGIMCICTKPIKSDKYIAPVDRENIKFMVESPYRVSEFLTELEIDNFIKYGEI